MDTDPEVVKCSFHVPGQFGRVHEGEYKDPNFAGEARKVAIKTLKCEHTVH